MSRYINADELLTRLPEDLPYKASVKRVLMQAPTADVAEEKRGKWTRSDEYDEQYGFLYKCSNCGRLGWIGNYCSYCGAKMDYEAAGGKPCDQK